MRKWVRRIIFILIVGLIAWHYWVPEDFKQDLRNEVHSFRSSVQETADGTRKSMKEEIAIIRGHDAAEDISNHPTVETDSTARDLRREGQENVNIQFYEEDTWYLNKEDLKEYYESAKRALKD
jgi:hypothetical protein